MIYYGASKNIEQYKYKTLFTNPNLFWKINDNKSLKEGILEMNNSSIIICGLARDCEKNLAENIKWIKYLCSLFKDYKIVIVENDSTDNTRKVLLDWAKIDNKVYILGCQINAEKCNLGLNKTLSSFDVSQNRIKKMVYLRNLYINFINSLKQQFKYTMVIDPDINGMFYIDGIINTMYHMKNNPEIDAIAANGINVIHNTYYDSFAYIPKDKKELYYKSMADKLLNDMEVQFLNFKNKYKLHKVKSAFAGVCIYRTASILNSRAKYDYSSVGYSCEHTYFNKNMNVYINPCMIGAVINNS